MSVSLHCIVTRHLRLVGIWSEFNVLANLISCENVWQKDEEGDNIDDDGDDNLLLRNSFIALSVDNINDGDDDAWCQI